MSGAVADRARRPPPATVAAGRHHVELVMGTAVSIDVRDDLPDDALVDVIAWLHHVDATFSTYRADSPISRIGTGTASAADLTEEVVEVLALCEALHDDTGGAFDAYVVPAPNGSSFDPSGVVKGWAIERAAAILERHGAANLCINAGGDVVLRGHPRRGAPWRVGIRHPDLPDLSAAVVAGAGRLAIATSATYERGAHIIDPATGEPTAELASVTIVGPDLTYADAYATAVFVMGTEGLLWLAREHPDHAGFVITREDTTLSTANFAEHRAG
jgi:thiamine biosynthesis lipoprotein